MKLNLNFTKQNYVFWSLYICKSKSWRVKIFTFTGYNLKVLSKDIY